MTSNRSAVCCLRALGFNYQGQIANIAVKQGQRCGYAFFTRKISAQPSYEEIVAMGCPRPAVTPDIKRANTQSSNITVREGILADAPFITETYNELILSSSAVEVYEEQTVAQKERWLAKIIEDGWLCLVVEVDAAAVGYLSFSKLCTRSCGMIINLMMFGSRAAYADEEKVRFIDR